MLSNNVIENRTHGHVLSNNVYAACTVRATIFSMGGKFHLVSNLMELQALTLATRSYAFLLSALLIIITLRILPLALSVMCKKKNYKFFFKL